MSGFRFITGVEHFYVPLMIIPEGNLRLVCWPWTISRGRRKGTQDVARRKGERKVDRFIALRFRGEAGCGYC
jgi:hypothetical protein